MTDLSHMTANVGLADLQRAQASANSVAGRAAAAKASGNNTETVAKEFEAMVLGQMLSPMMNTVSHDGPFSGGPGAKMFRSMMVDEMGKEIARSGGIGIADMVRQELMGLQEA